MSAENGQTGQTEASTNESESIRPEDLADMTIERLHNAGIALSLLFGVIENGSGPSAIGEKDLAIIVSDLGLPKKYEKSREIDALSNGDYGDRLRWVDEGSSELLEAIDTAIKAIDTLWDDMENAYECAEDALSEVWKDPQEAED